MSMYYAEVLLKRAREYLDSARRNLEQGLYGVAGVEAEIAAQLSLKALIVRLGLESPRTHSIRRLLSRLRALLGREAGIIDEFTREYRDKLIILERTWGAGQYGLESLDEYEARVAVETAEKVLRLVERLWEAVEEGF